MCFATVKLEGAGAVSDFTEEPYRNGIRVTKATIMDFEKEIEDLISPPVPSWINWLGDNPWFIIVFFQLIVVIINLFLKDEDEDEDEDPEEDVRKK